MEREGVMYRLGDLLALGEAYLQDSRFELSLDSELLNERFGDLWEEEGIVTGALVDVGDGDYNEVWLTSSRRPFYWSEVYERVV